MFTWYLRTGDSLPRMPGSGRTSCRHTNDEARADDCQVGISTRGVPAWQWLVLILFFGLLAACQALPVANPPPQAKPALQPSLVDLTPTQVNLSPTLTPFGPADPTPWQPEPTFLALETPAEPGIPLQVTPQAAVPTLVVRAPAVPVILEPSLNFYGIDFASHEKVTITIYPPDKKVNRGKPIRMSFIPAGNCRFGTKKACVYAYKPSVTGNVIILTVHSGVGGQAQSFRHALEGTGINRAGLGLEAVQRNLKGLNGAEVVIEQGGRKVSQRLVDGLVRIPARALGRYFRAPMAKILEVAADFNPRAVTWVIPQAPILVIETCGWKMNGEAGSQNASDTTGSIYLAVIR